MWKIHEYLGMTFDFTKKDKVMTEMIDCINGIKEDFPVKIFEKE